MRRQHYPGRSKEKISRPWCHAGLKAACACIATLTTFSLQAETLPGGWQLRSTDILWQAIPQFTPPDTAYLVRNTVSPTSWGLLSKGPTGKPRALYTIPNGTALPGGWVMGDDKPLVAGDFNGDARGDILISSHWGIGILTEGAPHGLKTIALEQFGKHLNGTQFGNALTWNLGLHDTHRVADFNKDGKSDLLVQSGWGIGVLTMAPDKTLTATQMAAF
ncbi:FG-GAP repeat domain-containing protein [Massilia pseudoviolaceinigra]|uniref:FG-GAP repeat domain-containing protein n=1 Tax=Massilia pseudoviolaceinigra TaxID=3057165 RepID=UPI0027966E0D|nr:VCBS repeat-containing protein [Massilia sp. CCM 9206]MDQ1922628.1 VCBS repeat-containing protein [Massilia sp. CCM 9206]